ncbi:MAG: hypothetical protein R2862_09230 [Thermoanaerobaculia bacterium]
MRRIGWGRLMPGVLSAFASFLCLATATAVAAQVAVPISAFPSLEGSPEILFPRGSGSGVAYYSRFENPEYRLFRVDGVAGTTTEVQLTNPYNACSRSISVELPSGLLLSDCSPDELWLIPPGSIIAIPVSALSGGLIRASANLGDAALILEATATARRIWWTDGTTENFHAVRIPAGESPSWTLIPNGIRGGHGCGRTGAWPEDRPHGSALLRAGDSRGAPLHSVVLSIDAIDEISLYFSR